MLEIKKKKNINLINLAIVCKNFHYYDFLYFFKFYTIYCILLQIFYYSYIIRINSITLLNIISSCSLGGWYICYIHPKNLYIKGYLIDVHTNGTIMYILDFLLHHLPLILFIYFEKTNIFKSDINYYEIFGFPLVYRFLVDPYEIYKINLIKQFFFVIFPVILLLLHQEIY